MSQFDIENFKHKILMSVPVCSCAVVYVSKFTTGLEVSECFCYLITKLEVDYDEFSVYTFNGNFTDGNF